MAETADEFLDLSAIEIRELLLSRQLSARELIESSLRRIDRLNPCVNAVCTVSDVALDEARRLDQAFQAGEAPGLLAGLPIGIKDLTDTANLRTTYGSTIYRDHVPDEDALVVQRLRQSGAIIIGKTNTPEFGAGATTTNELFGPTRNPWNPATTAGGSTGGGAAAVATGMIALADGTDLGGSLPIPAAFCGVVGLRPTPGLIPTIPTPYLWDTLEVSGGMARTAGDLALFIRAIAGQHPFSPLSRSFECSEGKSARPGSVRVAYCAEVAEIGIEPSLEIVCRRAAGRLQDAVTVVEEVKVDLGFARSAFAALRGLWMVVHHRQHLDRLSDLNRNLANNIRFGLSVSTEQLARAERDRSRVREILLRLLRNFDYLLTPCTAVPPFSIELDFPTVVCGKRTESYIDWFAPTFVLTLAGLPVASVPCGFDGDGMPVGLQIIGPPGGDFGVLSICTLVQETSPVGLPDLDRLRL